MDQRQPKELFEAENELQAVRQAIEAQEGEQLPVTKFTDRDPGQRTSPGQHPLDPVKLGELQERENYLQLWVTEERARQAKRKRETTRIISEPELHMDSRYDGPGGADSPPLAD